MVSRVKRMDDKDVPPPFGLFPSWKPQKTTRSTWFIFNFPTTYRSTTPSPRTTTKQRTPPAPKQPPTPLIPTKSPVPPIPAKSTTPASTAKRSDQVTTAQTEKLPTTATETEPMETSTVVITTKPETTQIHTTTFRPKTTSTTATTATTATTQAPTTTPQPTIENIPGGIFALYYLISMVFVKTFVHHMPARANGYSRRSRFPRCCYEILECINCPLESRMFVG